MILNQALKQAVLWRILVFNPCDAAKPPRQEKTEMRALSPEQARRFLAVAREDDYAALWELALTTGMRPSEYLALQWSDIDWRNGTVHIQRSIDRMPNGEWSFGENKTRRSRRPVKLSQGTLDALRQWREVQDGVRRDAGERWQEHGLIFTAANGSPADRHNLTRRRFRAILETAGLPAIRLYDLRHTYATLALSAGVPVKVVSEQLGHAGVALTLDVYSHVLPHMQDDAVSKVEALLAGDGGTPEAHQNAHHAKNWHTIGTPSLQ
ncbi:MAG: site-specific integrase [Bryobacterales bacterium]|nr:site-specific integrase [Bryobacterales bacterium]